MGGHYLERNESTLKELYSFAEQTVCFTFLYNHAHLTIPIMYALIYVCSIFCRIAQLYLLQVAMQDMVLHLTLIWLH